MRHKGFVLTWLGTVALGMAVIAAINYYVDPLWLFPHQNAYNQHQQGFDERQQKTNRVHFGEFDYDGLLLGSSRSTYIDQHAFVQNKVFSYAVSAMRPSEYGAYVAYARAKQGKAFKVVYVGLDFFATNKNYPGSSAPPLHYISTAAQPLYRLESLLSYDTLKHALSNLRGPRHDEPCDCYDRNNVKTLAQRSAAERAAAAAKDVAHHRDKVYGPGYAYDTSLKAILADLKRDNPDTRFVPYTTPISAPMFQALVDQGRLPDYQRWLGDIIEVYGMVYDFMGLNSITQNPDHYADASHFYGAIGTIMAAKMEQRGGPADFGVMVDAKTLGPHLASIQRQALAARGRN